MVAPEELRERLAPSPYRRKLVQEVQKKVQKALDAPTQRSDLLRQLFTDIALEVDSRARARLCGLNEYSQGDVSPKSNHLGRPLCYYEVLAEHYAQVPEDGKELLALFLQLWSQSFGSQIFTLIFYKWLFEVPSATESEGYLRYSTAFVEGASEIFWIDLQSSEQRFFSLYHYTLEEVVMNRKRNGRVSNQAQRDLVLMMSRFYFFYEPVTQLDKLLAQFPPFPTNLGPCDLFVIELTDQLQRVKVEPVLIKYLECAKVLKGMELRVTTSTRLKTALYGFTSPGGPLYPTRAVRHAAWGALDHLFPRLASPEPAPFSVVDENSVENAVAVRAPRFCQSLAGNQSNIRAPRPPVIGRKSRHLISLGFRLLHPYYWPMSFLHFVVNTILAFVRKVYGILLSIWHLLFNPRQVRQ